MLFKGTTRMQFIFAAPSAIIFGAGTIDRAATEAAKMGKRALLVTGRNPHRTVDFQGRLEEAGIVVSLFRVSGEPGVERVAQGAALARAQRCDLVVGMGGGSALDGAKAVAALATNTEPPETYLEVIGAGRPLGHAPLPCIAIPTTAGTGCEVTCNAVLKSTAHKVKVSLRSPRMLPDLAVVDPALTVSLPPAETASTGCDALTQLLEAFVSVKANPLTDTLCREGLVRAAKALPRVMARGDDLVARTDMALASLFSGLALANAGLGAVHGIAGPLGGMIDAPHGFLCARLLPYVVEVNLDALSRRQPHDPALARYAEVAQLLTGSPRASAADGALWLHELIHRLGIPCLGHWGLTSKDLPDLLARARIASSMKGNPIPLSDEELDRIVSRAL
jgi:alcohol dehydrogenase class IV